MLEIAPTLAAVIACAADPAILDRADRTAHRLRLRVAPDELWLVGSREHRSALLAEGQTLVGREGLAVDQTDGWWVLAATGKDQGEVIRRLMLAPMPAGRPTLVQGAIAGVPGKVVYESARILVFVPAGVGHHLMTRLAAVTGDLEVNLAPPIALTVDAAGTQC